MGVFSSDLDTIIFMMVILMKIILKLLFISDLWLGVADINSTNHVKRI